MPRPRFLSRRAEEPPPSDAPPAAVRRPLPPPGQLRRERRGLLREREQRIRDLGGLMLEMYRRDQFRQDLLVDRCGDLLALEDRLQEVEALLSTAHSLRHGPAARCACGAPVLWGSHFCANCGRPVGEAVLACAECGAPVPAEARFCVACGHRVEQQTRDAPEAQPQPAQGD
jgi:predicted amidophosphoribosyltransferase